MNTTPERLIAQYIKEHPLTVLSTISPSGFPNGSTIYAGSDDVLNVYFMTKTQTGKHINIEANPKIALTFSQEDHQETLQLYGTATEVTEQSEGAKAFEILNQIRLTRKDYRLPISKINAGPYVVYKVTVKYALLTGYEQTNQVDGPRKIEYINPSL